MLVELGSGRLEVEDGAGAMRIATELTSDRTTGGLRIVESMAMDRRCGATGREEGGMAETASPH